MGNIFSSEPDPDLPQPIVTFTRGTTTKDYKFEKLIKHVTEILSTLGTLVTLIPGVGTKVKAGIIIYKEGLKWVYALIGNQNEIISALIDEKIEKALAEFATSLINAEIKSIKNCIERMENGNIIIEERRTDAALALNSCEKILNLFRDVNFCLRKAVVTSSQLLIAFVAIYADVIKRTFELQPDRKPYLNSELAKTVETLKDYQRAVIKERVQEVYMEALGIHFQSISFEREEVISFRYVIRGDEKWTNRVHSYIPWRLTDPDFSTNASKLPPPWDELFCPIKISDKWIPWERNFPRNSEARIAVYKYKSYKNELRKAYEREFDLIISGLNGLWRVLNARKILAPDISVPDISAQINIRIINGSEHV